MVTDYAAIAAAALLIDLAVGDPRAIPHPVVGFGKAIVWFERKFRKSEWSPGAQRTMGVALVVYMLAISGGCTYALLELTSYIHPAFAWIVSAWIVSTTIAAKGLKDAGMHVYEALLAGDLPEARKRVGYIVGRDTGSLPEPEVARAAVETVAENIVDAVVSPVFYALLAGPAGAVMYRAVNTLDSMVGYKNDKYLYFGWASARLDDVLNYVPARIAGCLLTIAAASMRGADAARAWMAMRRDAAKHPSPNSGLPEAAVAGALGIQLGGENYYGGIASFRAHMGEATRGIEKEDIPRTSGLLYRTVGLLLVPLLLLAAPAVLALLG